MATIRVQHEAIDVAADIAALTTGRFDIGGIASFIGTVRDLARGRRITAMTLEHYPGMTERAIEKIVAEAKGRWQVKRSSWNHGRCSS